ncbi:MAG: DUF2206 domain-containing protein [Patescibacteria group bacterium]|nr:DUF2206 domain-containing protein [Patescibacteria group bacterium]
MTLTLKKDYFLLLFDIWWTFFILLVNTHFNAFQIQNIAAFISLIILPGFLTLMALRVRLPVWSALACMVACSLLELMFIGLAGNTLLSTLGIATPLQASFLLGEVSAGVVALAFAAWIRSGDAAICIEFTALPWRECLFAFSPALFVACSVAGAIALNNGGSGFITLACFLGIALYLWMLARASATLEEWVIPTALFFISLSLLFMTSLRGWYVSGHDIQREYLVFQLAKEHGFWAVGYLQDAYNACMSITILPATLSRFFSMADPYLYKVLYQIFFAFVPPALYLTVRRYLSPAFALLSAVYFVAFPTFFMDMPYLNRQEIAFIFLACMFLVLFEESLSMRLRRGLFMFFGIGMVLSHYSTTYTVIAILVFVYLMQKALSAVRGFFERRSYSPFARTSFADFNLSAVPAVPRITGLMVVSLMLASFLWSSVLTDTSQNSIVRVVKETLATMASNSKEDAQSSDVLYALFSWHPLNSQQLLAGYQQKVVAPQRAADPGDYFAQSAYKSYPIVLAPQEVMPLTALGSGLSALGFDVSSMNYILKQSSAKALQLLVVVGFCAALRGSRRVLSNIHSEFWLAACGSIVMVAGIVVLPVLSVEYGLLRAFQQSLLFLSLFVAIGSAVLFTEQKKATLFATIVAILFFLLSTGTIAQLTGGYDAPLYLNNSGSYYDRYYVDHSDERATSWVTGQLQKDIADGLHPELQSSELTIQSSTALYNLDVSVGVYPWLIRKSSYVLVGSPVVRRGVDNLSYNETPISYVYPIGFLDTNKDLLYDNGEARVYR